MARHRPTFKGELDMTTDFIDFFDADGELVRSVPFSEATVAELEEYRDTMAGYGRAGGYGEAADAAADELERRGVPVFRGE